MYHYGQSLVEGAKLGLTRYKTTTLRKQFEKSPSRSFLLAAVTVNAQQIKGAAAFAQRQHNDSSFKLFS